MRPLSASQLVCSPCCIPQYTLEQILPVYAEMGFRKFEGFSSWCTSALDFTRDPQPYRDLAGRYGMEFSSFHLPPIADDLEASLAHAIQAATFAQELGASVMLYKGTSRENYIRGAQPFLEAIHARGLTVTPVLQNHKGSPITTLEDFQAVICGIDDCRMKTLLEVGHFRRAGYTWRQGYDLLGRSIALVHINEIDAGGESVPFGTGTVDFAGLLAELARLDYRGNIVVELELATRDQDPLRTIAYLKEALQFLHEQGIEP